MVNSAVKQLRSLLLCYINSLLSFLTISTQHCLTERCSLRHLMFRRSPRYWSGLVPVIQCKELRNCQSGERARLYGSLVRRGFHGLCLLGACDEDAFDLVNSFPLASKHVHSLSMRCSSVTDRGLETVLDHLQVILCVSHAFCTFKFFCIVKFRFISII